MNRFLSRILFSLIFGSGFFISAELFAEEPVIAIIIDDIGWRKQDDLRALELPGAVTYSVLPQTSNTAFMSEKAREKGKEIMLHIPMEANKDNHLLGPGALTSDMSKEEFIATLETNFQSVPDAIGINNHMGSLLTNHKLSMHRLMNAMKRPNTPFFVDSKTTGSTLAGDVAEIYGIASTRRDVFLDNEKDEKSIRDQFQKLVKIAKQKGSALAIAHPHKETTEALKTLLTDLKSFGVKLIPMSEFMHYRDAKNYEWHESSPLTKIKN